MGQTAEQNRQLQATLDWVERVVVGLDLCPFAKWPLKVNQLKIHVSSEVAVDAILADFAFQMNSLCQQPEPSATILMVLTELGESFDDYLALLELAQALLVDLGFEGVLQIASFHPHYQFEGLDFDDPANYTNRSPYPMLHLLQEDAVQQAINYYPDTSEIPKRNEALMRSMSEAQLQALTHDKK